MWFVEQGMKYWTHKLHATRMSLVKFGFGSIFGSPKFFKKLKKIKKMETHGGLTMKGKRKGGEREREPMGFLF